MRVAVLDVVGLSASLIGEHMPRLAAFAQQSGGVSSFEPAFPALTTTAQSCYLTGKGVGEHGIVGNGWYNRDLCEVQFWKQPDQLVRGEKIWHELRRRMPEASVAKLFWWYNMYSEVDVSITPRPMYPADGRKFFDVYTHPPELRFEIQRQENLGKFPFQTFWGPAAGIASSEWIAQSARYVEQERQPHLSLVYLPHLDYPLQKLGPNHEQIGKHLGEIDVVIGELIEFYRQCGVEPVVLSEYGIGPVSEVLHPNRLLREAGLLTVKEELGRELLDAGASRAFAVVDHQVAHVVVNDGRVLERVRRIFEEHELVQRVATPAQLGWGDGVAAQRAGDLVLEAREDAWFAYPYWLDERRAPDFAHTIDIHRKPGYDPCELFVDPKIRFPKLKIGAFLAKKKLGIRALLEVIPNAPELVQGSHGIAHPPQGLCPVAIGRGAQRVGAATDVYGWLLGLCMDGE